MATGHLGTFVASTVPNTLKVVSIKPPKRALGVIAKPTLDIAVGAGMPYDPVEIVEEGVYTIELEDDNNTQFVHHLSASTGTTFKKSIGLKQTFTWTKPLAAGMASGATRAFTGFIISEDEGEQRSGSRNIITLEIQVDGTVAKVAGAA